ncbi:MAG: hypothetical protein JJE19_08150 [Methanosarcinales archaeon]|nr:hypothetical protein [Methanosarcinales archaeon]
MTEKEELEEAEKVFFARNIPFLEQIKALNTIHRILKKCGIEPQTGQSAVLRRRIAQAMKILDEEEAQK